MADYKEMYHKLFNAVTDSVNILHNAQLETEEAFISQKDSNIIKLNKPDNNDNV